MEEAQPDTIIIDLGGYSIKYGFSVDDFCRIMPNCISKVKSERRRLFIGDQLDECKDYSGLFYILPFNKGYLTNWEIEKQILDFLFKAKLNLTNFDDKNILITEPYFNFKTLQENLLELVFEEFGFGSLSRTNPAHLSALKYNQDKQSDTCLVVDAGYSFIHIVPFIEGKIIKEALRRIDVGGKALTNYLKDVISYRQLHVLDETFVINQCKEDCCFVSTQFFKDLETCKLKKNPIVRDYILPDFMTVRRGYMKENHDVNTDLQSLKMNNERFQIPELLFYPTDVGINEIGISHAIFYTIESVPEQFRPLLYQNIFLIGGCACFSGFKQRIFQDVRSMADHLYDVNVYLSDNPIKEAWLGGQYLVSNKLKILEKLTLSKKEYEENGVQVCLAKSD